MVFYFIKNEKKKTFTLNINTFKIMYFSYDIQPKKTRYFFSVCRYLEQLPRTQWLFSKLRQGIVTSHRSYPVTVLLRATIGLPSFKNSLPYAKGSIYFILKQNQRNQPCRR